MVTTPPLTGDPIEEVLRRREAAQRNPITVEKVKDNVEFSVPADRAVFGSHVHSKGTSQRVMLSRLDSRLSSLGNTVDAVRNSVLEDLARNDLPDTAELGPSDPDDSAIHLAPGG